MALARARASAASGIAAVLTAHSGGLFYAWSNHAARKLDLRIVQGATLRDTLRLMQPRLEYPPITALGEGRCIGGISSSGATIRRRLSSRCRLMVARRWQGLSCMALVSRYIRCRPVPSPLARIPWCLADLCCGKRGGGRVATAVKPDPVIQANVDLSEFLDLKEKRHSLGRTGRRRCVPLCGRVSARPAFLSWTRRRWLTPASSVGELRSSSP